MTTGLKVLNGLDLFSGIGGIGLALSPWVRTVAYCEQDRYAQAVLMSRMRAGDIDRAPIWDDVRTLRGDMLDGIDIIFGGFPCQDISVAGAGRGLEGDRSGLFFEIVRLAEEVQPAFLFLENVAAIRTRGLARVCVELARLGFDLRWTTVSAAEVGAPHLRRRWFLLAAHPDRLWELQQTGSEREVRDGLGKLCGSFSNPDRIGLRDGREWSSEGEAEADRLARHDGAEKPLADAAGLGRGEGRAESAGFEGRPNTAFGGENVADRDREGLEVREQREARQFEATFRRGWWSTEPDVGRAFDGISAGMDGSGRYGDAEAEETGAAQVMRALLDPALSQTIWEETRGLECVQAEAILLSIVREYEARDWGTRGILESAETLEEFVRALRANREAARPSLRPGSAEQYFREYPDALRELSQLVASRGKTPWDHPLWECAVPRVTTGLPYRVDRIRCLGNAVVPLQARTAFTRLLGIEAAEGLGGCQ